VLLVQVNLIAAAQRAEPHGLPSFCPNSSRLIRHPDRHSWCSSSRAADLECPAARDQSLWLSAADRRPEQRSNDGQAILKGHPGKITILL
jgi:hypothetical protein